MSETTTSGETSHDQDSTRQLALRLVRHLGLKGATRTCIENQWPGVLAIVRQMTPPTKSG